MKDKECCPHCKGTTGYVLRQTVVQEEWWLWSEKIDRCVDVSAASIRRNKFATCKDCGKRVEINEQNT